MEKTHFVFAPDLAASIAWYNALLGSTPVADGHRIRYCLAHEEVILTTWGRVGQHRLALDSLREVRRHLATDSAEAIPTVDFVFCHDPAGNKVLFVHTRSV